MTDKEKRQRRIQKAVNNATRKMGNDLAALQQRADRMAASLSAKLAAAEAEIIELKRRNLELSNQLIGL
jgi:hypothetical protein